MNLASPIIIQPPSYKRGQETISLPAFTISKLSLFLSDVPDQKLAAARIDRFPKALVLWSGEAYDAIGDWTQAQAEARILELLGGDIKAGLEALFQ